MTIRYLVAAVSMVLLAFVAGRAAEDAKPTASAAAHAGRKIETFSLADFRGKSWSLADFKEKKLVVVAFVGSECPLAQLYGARLAELAKKYQPAGVAFLAVNSNQQDSLAKIAHYAAANQIEFPLLKDPGNRVADQFGAERTPEVFVLNAERAICYHGRIDDQHTYGRSRPKVENQYLAAALDELLAGKPVSTAHVASVGCHIGRVRQPKEGGDVTYSKQISRLLQDHCVRCHRPGEVAPFSLTDYQAVVGWAAMIKEVVDERRMPPWHANPAHGKFTNDQRLSDEEISLISRWVAAGAPAGDVKDLPPPQQFAEGWQIGQPDQIVYISEKPYSVPEKGVVRYQYFIVDPGFKEDKWVRAAECRPGNRAVVHHIIVGLIPPGNVRRGKDVGGLHSEFLTATAPGAPPMILRDGQAKFVPAGSKLVFQLHYTPNGTAGLTDRSSVGLIFADGKKVRQMVGTDKAATTKLNIPPGDGNHYESAAHRFNKDTLLLSMFPHMHLRGKAFRYTAQYPNGEKEILLDVPHYDFNWQLGYQLVQPKLLPGGTVMFCEAWYDNSKDNLANPDPAATVRWGDQTWEEMMIGYFDATPVEQKLGQVTERRTDAFQKTAQSKEGAAWNADVPKLASAALEGDTQWMRLGLALRKTMPQLDRTCLTFVDGSAIEIRLCAQPPELEKAVGGKGRRGGAKWMKMTEYASGKEPIYLPNLDAAEGIDLKYMSRGYASSFHIPVRREGAPGVLSFWSTEKDAFPPAAQKLLREIALTLFKP